MLLLAIGKVKLNKLILHYLVFELKHFLYQAQVTGIFRVVARFENPGGLVVLGGENVPPLVEIGLTDLPKT